MTLTDVIAKRTVYGKRVIVTDNSSSPALSVNQNGSGESAFFTAAPPLSGTLRLFWPDSTLGGDFVYNGGSDGIFLFKDNGGKTAFMGGDIGIGVLSATEKLDVNGKIKSKNESIVNGATSQFKFLSLRTNNLTRWDIGSDNVAESGANAGSDFFIHRFNDAGTFIDRVMHITRSTGYVGFGITPTHPLQMASGAHVTVGGTWTNASDKKLKENISYEYPYGLDQILNLKPAKFDFIKGEKNTIGFIAQDVKEELPEAISTTKNSDDEEIMGINSTAIIATLVKAVQELSSKVDQLAEKVEELETEEPTQQP